ncbi:MAG: STAS domain-containing protein [Agriterribacter sp.]
MNVKIDTKEKFHVISIIEPSLSANMTEEIRNWLDEVTQNHVKHVILNLKDVKEIDATMAGFMAAQYEAACEEGRSFVLCEMQPAVKNTFIAEDLLDVINYTPTESEAWDIVQMEEIERELLDGEG